MEYMLAFLKRLRLGVLLLGVGVASAQPPEPMIAEMFLEHAQVEPGGTLNVAIRLKPDPGWHSYWVNPGDAGRGTQAVFSGVEGLQVSGPQWPVPEAVREDVLMTYAYAHDHTLLYQLQLPADFSGTAQLQAKVDWLICKDICIPGGATLVEPLAAGPRGAPRDADVFAAARAALPAPHSGAEGRFELGAGHLRLQLPPGQPQPQQLFLAQPYLLDHAAAPRWATEEPARVAWPLSFEGVELPARLEAVLVDDSGARWLRFAPGPVAPVAGGAVAPAPAPDGSDLPGLWQALLLAFAGGLLLNLMPCVFPVLALKAVGLARGENLQEKRRDAGYYTLGVLLSFLALAAALLLLRAAGSALGWGFQLQNPAVVAALAVLMAYLGLALAGWTQIGTGIMGWGQGLSAGHGRRAAFFTGVLAVVVASPCTAPFMGAALGYAVTQPAAIALGVFAALGLGLAAPILLLAIVPALARHLPRPGPWMERFKLLMAVPLLGTALWLFWVVGSQAGLLAALLAGLALVILAIATRESPRGRWVSAAPLRGGAYLLVLGLMLAPTLFPPAESRVAGAWEPWSAQRVAELQGEGRAVFVDFTADWCISCLVNEQAALNSTAVQQAFADKGVVLLKADWTRQDAAITAGLAEFGRNGVPLYLLYDGRGGVQVLPQVLTSGLVLEALQEL